jgi:hypothetical protein
MISNMKKLFAVVSIVLIYASAAHAAHPLITDDTGPQGKRNFQFAMTETI